MFNSQPVRQQIRASASGIKVRHTAPGRIAEVKVCVPSFPLQRRIAGILSAYDDLIGNNQQRIKILEEMARALYREWFVYFRFPGHENVPLVASPLGMIPEGWKVTDLEKVCMEENGIQTGPFGSQLHEADYSHEGVPVVMPKDLIGFRICTDSIAYIPEATAERLCRHRMKPGDIVYGRRGDIGRRAFVMPHQSGWLCGTGCLRIRPNPLVVKGWYLFNYLGQDNIVSLIAGRAHGATMPNLNTRLMASVPIALAQRELQNRFSSMTLPMAEVCETIAARIENLRCTRDLFLPRLLSGQVALDGFSLEVSISANGEDAPSAPVVVKEPVSRDTEVDEEPPPIDQIDRSEVLTLIRQIFSDGQPRDRETATREVAHALGYRRTGSHIQEVLHTDLLTASRRGIWENVGGELQLLARSMADYDRDFLKQQFLAAIGRAWIERDETIREFCRWMGFARTGSVIEDTARSLINGLLREGRLEADGAQLIRRTS